MRNGVLDALVVGAGPVGLTVAAELARHEVRCRIVDRSAAPSDKSKALVLWPRTLELLDLGGAADPFVAAGLPVHVARLFGEGEPLADLAFDGVASPFPFALMLPQNETERLLAESLAARGVAVERGVELGEFAADAEQVAATLRCPDGSVETVRCGWLIGCDGAHSTVRHGLGIDFAGAAEPNDWILADVHVDGPLPTDEIRIYWHADGILAFFPIAPGHCRVVADTGPAAGGDKPRDPSLRDVQGVVDRRGPAGVTLRDPIWLAGFRINERKVAEYRRGRVLLAGDAAHIHSPAGGQGMNTGMQDAFNLAWKLALVQRGRGRLALIESYSPERSAVGDLVLRNAGAMTRVATLRHRTAQQVRNALLPVLASFGAVRDRLRDTFTELSIHYRDSALSRDDRGPAARAHARLDAVVAGDRAPDVALGPVQLFALLRGTRHHLFLCADEAGAPHLGEVAAAVRRDFAELIDTHVVAPPDAAALRDAYGLHGPAGVLVRPDGYIGWIGSAVDPQSLLEHLASYLVPTSG
jgi:2-polyprenyl-6-methoxyphenol hydroxylase-like FAD-dependent oxidoreductase